MPVSVAFLGKTIEIIKYYLSVFLVRPFNECRRAKKKCNRATLIPPPSHQKKKVKVNGFSLTFSLAQLLTSNLLLYPGNFIDRTRQIRGSDEWTNQRLRGTHKELDSRYTGRRWSSKRNITAEKEKSKERCTFKARIRGINRWIRTITGNWWRSGLI